ncbi:MAG: DUF1295 domain-containing protein [Candidatus Nealsonbacteria bacterium]|nr:DUF1295 domain-containing protein [Candidatus Nealsonbacteria bacterium]
MNKEEINKKHDHRRSLAGECKWGDPVQFILFFIFMIAVVLDKAVFNFSNNFSSLLPAWVKWLVGLISILAGVIFIQDGHRVFEEIRGEPRVIKEGVFRVVRHPIYLGSIMTYFGFSILSMSILAFLVLLAIVAFYYYISVYEEKLLLEKFGDEYRNYMKQTPRMNLFLGLIGGIISKDK